MKPIEFKTSGFGKSIDEIHQFFCLFNDDKHKIPFYFNGIKCYYSGFELNNSELMKSELVFEANLYNSYTEEELVGKVEIKIPYKHILNGNVTFSVGWDE